MMSDHGHQNGPEGWFSRLRHRVGHFVAHDHDHAPVSDILDTGAVGVRATKVSLVGLGITQSAISQLERSGDVKLSTLRTYLEKLGARLELLAVFDEDDEEHVVTIHIGDRVGAT